MELILIPTALERDFCVEALGERPQNTHVELCGWGPIHSAIRTTELLQDLKPWRVWLLGLAGAYTCPTRPVGLELGQAYEFTQAAIYGIGVGEGANHLSFENLAWNKRFGDSPEIPAVVDLPSRPEGKMLVTVCSASANPEEAARRQQEFPGASGEDMESYSVAIACRAKKVPLRIIRGISNTAGDRDFQNWNAKQAMRAAIETTYDLMINDR